MVIAIQDSRFVLDQTCFYPGGGGQPSDSGFAALPDGSRIEIASAFMDEEQVIWHVCKSEMDPGLVGQKIWVKINSERRLSLSRYHTVLHILNTIALRDYNGWITGVQIGEEYSRIDFNLETLSTELCAELEAKVNAVLQAGHPITSYWMSEDEYRNRPELLRTLNVKPPITDGHVRVVEIRGFDIQACGGTHVASTLDLGRFSIFRTENKGRKNKRLYIKLE
ncbi:MAG: serine-tRNA(Ala) deacylase AlaX [Anaerolineaceae bacterium]|nr:MAG: serine-tRNA(Ala) deacylase AlaX [Anaerolineaceae bacterium]